MEIKENLTTNEVAELQGLLVKWEDKNISDNEYCHKAGEILGLGGWTNKGHGK